MSTLNIILTIAAIVGTAFVIWTYTPSGKKWLKNL